MNAGETQSVWEIETSIGGVGTRAGSRGRTKREKQERSDHRLKKKASSRILNKSKVVETKKTRELGSSLNIGNSGTSVDTANRVETIKSRKSKSGAKNAAAHGTKTKGANSASTTGKLHSRYVARAFLVMLWAGSGAAVYARGDAVETFFLAILTAVVVCVLVLPYAARGRIKVERVIEEEGMLGDGGQMTVQLRVQLSRVLPLMWISVSEGIVNRTNPQYAAVPYRSVRVPGFSRVINIRYTLKGLQRGELEFQPIRIAMGDLLGMTVRTLELSCASAVLVKPKPPEGERLDGLPGSTPGANANKDKPIASATGLTLTASAKVSRDGMGPEVRTYVPGEPLRRIDGRAMARGLGMQTRISNAEQPSEVIIMLEASQEAYGQELRMFDANVGWAAVALRHAFEEGKGVTIRSNNLEEWKLIVRAGDKAALRQAEDKLSTLRANGVKPLFEALSAVIGQLPQGAAVVCLAVGHAAGASNAKAIEFESAAYGAKLAGIRGVRLYLLMAYRGSTQEEREGLERLHGAGCWVKGMPVPVDYWNNRPIAVEGGYVDVIASIS